MKCPVCEYAMKNEKLCFHCGFNKIKTEFLTEEDYSDWVENTVTPCRFIYEAQLKELASLKKQIIELKKENEKLKNNQMASGKNLYEFFENNGFEVIDKRSSGGCLWVVGTKTKLEPYVKKATELFKVTAHGFSSGRATANRTGWFTNSKD